jgi:hypothetical protein
LLAVVAVIAIIGSASAASVGMKKFIEARGAPQQNLPVEGGICHDAVRGYDCPLYEYYRDGVGFEFRAYFDTYALACPRIGTAGQPWENLNPCYEDLVAFFGGSNSAGLVINQTAPFAIEVAEYNVGYEIFTVLFFFPNNFGKIPEPKAGSGLVITPVDKIEVIVATFAPTDIFGQGGAAVGDHQIYDAAGTLDYRAGRRGIPVVKERFLYVDYNPDRSSFSDANLRHEVHLVLDFEGSSPVSFGQQGLNKLNQVKSA